MRFTGFWEEASLIVAWNLGVWGKFGLLLVLGMSSTLLIYEFGVRRWNPMRVLFGLKSRLKLADLPQAQA